MSVLTENWHTWYIGGVNFESRLRFFIFRPQIPFFGKFGPKIQSFPSSLKIGAHSISRMLILNQDLDFWSFDLKTHFRANLGPKIQRCLFCLKIGAHGISRMLILTPTLVFGIQILIFFLGKFGPKRVKFVCFNWKLAQLISRGCWFLFQN